ncbi:MAG: phage holin family protein [Bacteroidales bacterium]|nr:phage holin family protein [Bacteroidales bacterium]
MDLIHRLFRKSPRNEKTAQDVKTYLTEYYDLFKLELLGKSSQLLSVIFSMLIVIVCALVVIVYLSSAIIKCLTAVLGAGWAYAIVCGILIITIIVVWCFKDSLFVKPLVRKFSRILYPSHDAEVAEILNDEEPSPIGSPQGPDNYTEGGSHE